MNESHIDAGETKCTEDELVSVRDDRKLYELDIYEAIEREKSIRRDKDDVVRFAVSLDVQLTDEIDSIEDKLNCSEEMIRNVLIMHGLSIIQRKLRKAIKEIGRMRVLLINCDNSGIRSRASSANNALYERQVNVKRRNVTIPKNVTGSVDKISKIMFMDSMTFYQVCMAFSLFTRDDIIPDRKTYFGERRKFFVSHVRGQYEQFRGQEYILNEVLGSDEYRSVFDIDEL